MFFRSTLFFCFIAFASYTAHAAHSLPVDAKYNYGSNQSVSSPLPPEYVIEEDGSVTLRICFNWSCASMETMKFNAEDIQLIKRRMATCPDNSLHNRLQRVRIGIWQMEAMAEKYQPLLANDLPQNELEENVVGRTDCIDNSSNTSTYLHILRELGELPGWDILSPRVRNRFNITSIHWSAVILDTETGVSWSVDSWFRQNGHLPIVQPLQDWFDEKDSSESPFEKVNAIPRNITGLCETT